MPFRQSIIHEYIKADREVSAILQVTTIHL